METLAALVIEGSIRVATSFYALHELYIFALDNAPEFSTGAAYGKAAIEKVIALPIQLLPFVSRVDRAVHARRFRALRDSSDLPHAIVAMVYGCEVIVTYDSHFLPISHIIPCKPPEAFLDTESY